MSTTRYRGGVTGLPPLTAGGGSGGVSAGEEARWRRWVDERFVKVLTANIYRSWE